MPDASSSEHAVTASGASPAAVPAGWYDDPSHAGAQRWWDGLAWTEHVHVASTDAAVEPVAPPGWYVDGSGTTRWWDGSAWTWPAAATEPVPEPEPVVAEPVAALPAGWYVDDHAAVRWWDGAAWTAHVADLSPAAPSAAGAETVHVAEAALPVAAAEPAAGDAADHAPAVVAAAAVAAASWPAAWYPDPAAPGLLRWWDGSAWTGHAYLSQGEGDVPAPPVAAAPAVVVLEPGRRAPLRRRTWAIVAVALAASAALFVLAWRSANVEQVPATPTIHVVDTPAPVVTPSPAGGDASPAPSLSVQRIS